MNMLTRSSIIPSMMKKPHVAGVSRFLSRLSKATACDKIIHETIMGPTYKRMMPRWASIFKLAEDDLEADDEDIQSYEDPATRSNTPVALSTIAIEFLEIVQRCMRLRLESDAADLLARSLPPVHMHQGQYKMNWRPLLVFSKSLIETIQPFDNQALNNHTARWVTRAIQSASKNLADNHPKHPRDWSRPYAQRLGCGCAPCRQLRFFLIDPIQPVSRFTYPEKTCKHLEENLIDRRDFEFDAERGQSPYTLVIYKTSNGYTRGLQEWKDEVADLRRSLADSRSDFVTELLGGDVLVVSGLDDALMAAGAVEGLEVNASQPLQPTLASAQNIPSPVQIVAGTKRKAMESD